MLGCSGLKVEINSEYAPEYLELILSKLHEIWSLDEKNLSMAKGTIRVRNSGITKS